MNKSYLTPMRISKGLTKKYMNEQKLQNENSLSGYLQNIQVKTSNGTQLIPSIIFKSLAKMDLQVRGALFR